MSRFIDSREDSHCGLLDNMAATLASISGHCDGMLLLSGTSSFDQMADSTIIVLSETLYGTECNGDWEQKSRSVRSVGRATPQCSQRELSLFQVGSVLMKTEVLMNGYMSGHNVFAAPSGT